MSSPSAPQLPPDIDHGSSLKAIWWTELSIATVFILLRFWSRLVKRTHGIDDALMVASWICYIGATVAVHFIAETGSVRHLMYLGTIPKIDEAVKLILITLDVGIWVTGLGKLAIGITILRIIGDTSKWQKWAVWIVMGLTLSTCIVDFCLTTFRCGDPRIAWTVELWATSNCISETANSNFNIFSNAVQVLADFAFSIIPMTVVWGLRMSLSLRRRIYLAVALGLTLVTGAVGTVKMVLAATMDSVDVTYNTYPVLIWFGTEAMLIVVCGSVPSLYPLYERYIRQPREGTEKFGSRTYVYSGSNTSKWSKINSKLRSKQSVSFGTLQETEEQRSDVELARMAGNPIQVPATAAAAVSKYPDSWMYDDTDAAIHVVSEVDVKSGRRSQSRHEDV